jgi:hypothetical protein
VTPRLTDAATRYVDDVAAHLGSLPATERRAALEDLREALAEGIDPADLGPAEDYAAALATSTPTTDREESLGRVLGLPVDVRAATHREVRSRIFDPSDERLFVPRVLGAGWTVNHGALAVRLGLLRPDDLDEEVLAHIPASVQRITHAIPWVAAAKTAIWAAIAWRTGTRVPTHWDASGQVDGWGDRRTTLLPLVALGAGAAWWGTRKTPDAFDRLVRRALGASTASMTTAVAVLTALSAHRPDQSHPEAVLVALAPLAMSTAMLTGPVRAGLRNLPSNSRKDPS